jgi:hypothetical protein
MQRYSGLARKKLLGNTIVLSVLLSMVLLCQNSYADYIITGDTQAIHQSETNVTINKIIDGTSLNYKIITPKVDDFEFVLALDSSGSFGLSDGKSESEKDAVLDAVPKFLNYAKTNYSDKKYNFRVAIIGWNKGLDFKYGTSKNGSSNVTLVPIEKAVNEIDNLLQNNYNPTEDKQTDFSTAIKASLDILDSNPPAKYNRTLRFIMMVTDEGEFIRCDPKLIERAERANYKIYVIGIKVKEPPKQSAVYDNLMQMISNNREEQMQLVNAPNLLEPSLDKLLYQALESSLDNATNSSVANNVQFIETVYSYLNPKSVVIRYPDSRTRVINLAPIKNADGTKTIYFKLPKGLTANSETDITINSDLELNLPVSVTKDRHSVILCTPTSADVTPSSRISYDWLQLPTVYQDLTENQMNIRGYSNDAQAQKSDPPVDLPRPTTSLIFRLLNFINLNKAFG